MEMLKVTDKRRDDTQAIRRAAADPEYRKKASESLRKYHAEKIQRQEANR